LLDYSHLAQMRMIFFFPTKKAIIGFFINEWMWFFAALAILVWIYISCH
jgi:hypothetical protein